MLVTARESQAGTADERAEWIARLEQTEPWSAEQRAQLIEGLNQFVLTERGFHRGDVEVAFLDILPGPVARGLLARDRERLRRVEVERLNRSLLESAYPDYVQQHTWETPARQAANLSAVFGNANLAMLLAAVIAILVLVRQRGLARRELAHVLEISLMSGGVIILITSAGGAFGAMLIAAEVGDAIRSLFEVEGTGAQHGIVFLALGFLTASVLKVAQGSGTVAMITGSAMMAGVASTVILGCHPVYLATCIGAGSLVGSWMNDSGFWIFAKMSGLTEVETLKSWTIVLIALGTVSFLVSLLLSRLMPLV
jgi:gluconate:H+ symporter, GntP family